MNKLKSIDLALSSACGANCIFCPTNRGKRIKQKIMPFKYAEKIINEVSQDFEIQRVSVGENGDAFLNQDIIKILRLIKLKLPNTKTTLSTNFQNFTPDKIDIILRERLIDEFSCNIDGSNEQNYFNTKRLNYKNTMNNLAYFLETRKKLKHYPPLNVYVITFHRYLHTIYNNFKFYPSKLKGFNIKKLLKIPDDFLIIKRQLEKILNTQKDTVTEVRPLAWAEREQFIEKYGTDKINYKKYPCPLFPSIPNQAFIAPDGSWYMCCLDSNTEIVFGNVIKQSVKEVYHSPKRKELIKMLQNREYTRIGGPCKTVNCCQFISKTKLELIIYKIKRVIFKFKTILKG
ncbi:MAG: radical SAM protein [Nanoarchaeota archaeon]|nr:radical SAM protein [Nanoarchaeota archaeon]